MKQSCSKGLATLLKHVNKQNFIIFFKNIFIFFLFVIFCCDVGESDVKSEANAWATRLTQRRCVIQSITVVLSHKIFGCSFLDLWRECAALYTIHDAFLQALTGAF